MLLSLEEEQGKEGILKAFQSDISPETIQNLSMKLQSNESLDCLMLKALGRLNKSGVLSTSVEETKSRYITESVQILRTPHHLKAMCHNQQLNNNTLVLLSSKGISKYNVHTCLFK